jgi:DNA repair protein RadC
MVYMVPSESSAYKVYGLISRQLKSASGRQGIQAQGVSEVPPLPLEKDPLALKMFHRIGLIKTAKETSTNRERIQKIIKDIAQVDGEPPANVERAFALYSSAPGAICGDSPLCSECDLTGLCRYFSRRPSLKELPVQERPRERLIAMGEESLSDAELLGIIIRDGTPEDSAVDLAEKLLARYGDFRNLAAKTVAEISKIKGIGKAKAAQVKAALAIARRYNSKPLYCGDQIRSSTDVYHHFHERLRDRRQETFLLVLLDSKNKIIKDLQISAGSLSSSLVHPREVFSPAIRESAASVIFVHNHPSGDPTPSKEDLELTSRLVEVAEVVGIKVLDHVVIGAEHYVSLKDKGLF